ncbi:hypothetical protein C2845_PM02G15180 [Panicum miliaceum]|uniref:BTB/POZ and MATH domain-containing protein 2-like n=1 Tax=Panicum miliaceum TaxID=4540 RepID=A0A3L6SE54_PANMI|nr:hypothetical protein C2845_PM02G15180 [Panicum miliaceum]
MAEAAMEMPQKTASTHRSAFVRGTHQFDIVGYSVRTALGVSNSVRSGAFDAGGRTWALVCCFEPRKLGSICLELLSTYITRDVVAMASLRIDDPTGAGRWPAAVWRSHEAHTFPARSSASSSTRTWELSVPNAFKEARYVHDDRLTVHCTVDVLEEDDATPAKTRNRFVSAPPPPSISQDLQRLLEAEESRWPPDVTFVVEGTEIQAHKLVLSMRSPVFRAEFQGSMKERFTRSVRIDGMSASTFRAMLRFIYTDELPVKPKGVASQDACRNKHLARRRAAMARDLLVAADRYDLERLRLMCESILSESIDATTVLATLALVDGRYSCWQLEASCIEYLASGPGTFAAVVATPEYQELRESSVSLVADIAEKVAMHKLAGTCSSCSSSSSTITSSVRPKKSSCAYTAVAARGTHEFTIPNLSTVLMGTLDIGHCIHSGRFHVGGYNWWLFVEVEEPKVHLSVYLQLLTDPGTDNVVAATTLDVADPNNKSPSPMCKQFTRAFSKEKEEMAWGYPDFITLESAKSQYVGHDGSLTICCHVEVASKPESASVVGGGAAAATITMPPSNIAWHLEQLLVREQGLDVEFLVEGETVLRAHRLVLAARAPALHEQVAAAAVAGMDGGGRVRIDGMRAVVFEAVLHFVYTDQLPSSGGLRDDMVMAGDVLAAAAGTVWRGSRPCARTFWPSPSPRRML